MNKRIDYQLLIEEIKKKDSITIDQKLAKKLYNDELPKSCFNKNYLKRGSNKLARFLIENEDLYEIEVVHPQIKVRKKNTNQD